MAETVASLTKRVAALERKVQQLEISEASHFSMARQWVKEDRERLTRIEAKDMVQDKQLQEGGERLAILADEVANLEGSIGYANSAMASTEHRITVKLNEVMEALKQAV